MTGNTDHLDLKKEMTNKLVNDFSKISYKSMITAWNTNMLARSLMGMIPFYKPFIRLEQFVIRMQHPSATA